MPHPDISPAILKKLAGTGAYQRGRDYFKDGSVVEWEKKRNKVLGFVQGSETYSVTLELSKQGLDGFCDCPASDGIDFCKHCVALALQFQSENAQQEKLAKGNSGQRIQAYLETLPKEKLLEHLLEIINEDRELKQQWSITADLALGKVDAKNLKKRLTSAFPLNKHLYRYPQVRAYFARAEPIVELLQQQLPGLPADKALTLVDYGIDRMFKALSTIDDSGGFRYKAQELLLQMQFETLNRIGWSKTQFADYVLSLFDAPMRDLLPAIPDAYLQFLDTEGEKHFLQTIQQRWDSLPPLPSGATWEAKGPYLRLKYILIDKAKRDGDLEAMVAVLEKLATEPDDFSRLCELCIDYKDWAQAQIWLNRARDCEADHSRPAFKNHSIDRLQIKILLHNKEKSLAIDILWNIFKESPSIEDYQELVRLTGKKKAAEVYRRATGLLQNTIAKKQRDYIASDAVNTLFELYLGNNKLDDALLLADKSYNSDKKYLILAREFGQQFEKSFPLYQKLIESSVDRANNPAYQGAVALIQELRKAFKKTKSTTAVEQYITTLRTKYKAKRNFIKYLDQAEQSF